MIAMMEMIFGLGVSAFEQVYTGCSDVDSASISTCCSVIAMDLILIQSIMWELGCEICCDSFPGMESLLQDALRVAGGLTGPVQRCV